MRQRRAEMAENEVDIRFIVFIDRRVVGEPEDIGLGAGNFGIGGEGKFFGREAGGDQFDDARLEAHAAFGFRAARNSSAAASVQLHCTGIAPSTCSPSARGSTPSA